MRKKITKTMTLGEILEMHPKSAEIMMSYGLHCVGCHVSLWESLGQGAAVHGIGGKQLNKMLAELNKLADKGRTK